MPITDKLSAIADAIREKDGTTATIKLAEMPDKIRAIPSGGGGTCTVTLKNDGISNFAYVKDERGTKYFTHGDSFVINSGDNIKVCVNYGIPATNHVYMNGSLLFDGGNTEKDIPITADTTVLFEKRAAGGGADARFATGGYVYLQVKNVGIREQTVTADDGYDGLAAVNIR